MIGKHFDVAVIGGGPGGYVAAIAAAKAGKEVCLFEAKRVGGVCLNEGCIPTKALLKSVNVLNVLNNAEQYGIACENKIDFHVDMNALQTRKTNIINQLVRGIEFLLKSNKVSVINSKASFVNANTLKFDNGEITAESIIIAAGSEVFKLPITIGDKAKIMTSTDVLNLDYIPQEIAIIGGGVVGVELAFFLAGAGAKVTILEMMDKILPMIDEEIVKHVNRLLLSKGIHILTKVAVKSIDEKSVTYEDDGNLKIINCEAVVMAAGRIPSTEGLNLDAAGVEMNKRAVNTDDHMRTNIKNIYAIGDINGKSMLAHTASKEAEVAVENICGKESVMDYSYVPSCIYLEPEIASVGITEKQAIDNGKKVKIGKFPLSANGKALIEGESAGMIKVIVDETTDKILGAHIFGVHGTDIISGISVAMVNELTSLNIIDTIYPHPTVSEIVHEAFLSAYGKAIHVK